MTAPTTGADGGPAFPCPMSEQTQRNQDRAPFQGGMTLRQYYVGQALAGLCANPNVGTIVVGAGHGCDEEAIAGAVVKLADAVLAALAAREGA